jgi:hypothetical protein
MGYTLQHPPGMMADFELTRSLRDLRAMISKLPASAPECRRLQSLADAVTAEQADRRKARGPAGRRDIAQGACHG